MKQVLILLLVAIVVTTSLPAGPAEDQAIEPQAKPESRQRRFKVGPYPKEFKTEHAEKNCESCGDETDEDCKIRRLECIVGNLVKALTISYKFFPEQM